MPVAIHFALGQNSNGNDFDKSSIGLFDFEFHVIEFVLAASSRDLIQLVNQQTRYGGEFVVLW